MYDADVPILVGLALFLSALVGLLALGILGGGAHDENVSGMSVPLQRLAIEGVSIHVEIADEEHERIQGLSGREVLPTDQGLLFVFETPGRYSIWMRDMRFPLDIYWIDDEGVIVDAWKNATPESYPFVFEPSAPARYVLEVVGGFSEVYNIDVGDRVTGLDELKL